MAFSAKNLINQTKMGVSIGFGVAALFLNTMKSDAQTTQKATNPVAKTKSVVSEEEKKLDQEKKMILASIKNYIGAEEYHRLGEAGFRNFDVSIFGISGPGKQLIDITSKKKYYESPNKDLSNTATFSLRFINSSDSVNIDPKTLHELYRNYELLVLDLSASDKSVTTSFSLDKLLHAHASLVVDQTEENKDYSRYGSMYKDTVGFDKYHDAFFEIASKPMATNAKEFITHFKNDFSKDVQAKFDKQLKEKDKYPKFEDPNAFNEKLLRKNPAALLPIDKNRINEPEYYQKANFALQSRIGKIFLPDSVQLVKYKFDNFATQLTGSAIDHFSKFLTLNYIAKKEVNSRDGKNYKTEAATKTKKIVDTKGTGELEETPTDGLMVQSILTDGSITVSKAVTIDFGTDYLSIDIAKDSIGRNGDIHRMPGSSKTRIQTDKNGVLQIDEGKGFKPAAKEVSLEKLKEEVVDLFWSNVAGLADKKTKALPRGWEEQLESVVSRVLYVQHESDQSTVTRPVAKPKN